MEEGKGGGEEEEGEAMEEGKGGGEEEEGEAMEGKGGGEEEEGGGEEGEGRRAIQPQIYIVSILFLVPDHGHISDVMFLWTNHWPQTASRNHSTI